jgi:hypothetical protein
MIDTDFDNNPAAANTGANDFRHGGAQYNLTDARDITTVARGLQGFVQALITARNPLSNDGRGT